MHPTLTGLSSTIRFREDVRETDPDAVRGIVASAGFFYDHEVKVAVQLVNDRLAEGTASGYHFLFADAEGQAIGYSCYGEIPCTVGSFDLYWIAVLQGRRGKGVGRAILLETERKIASLGGRRVYAETSSRELYQPTRSFYERCGYIAEARLEAFYAPGDDKIVYVKPLA